MYILIMTSATVHWMNLFFVFEIEYPGHVIIDDHDDIGAGGEFTIEDVIADTAYIALDTRCTFNDGGGGIGCVVICRFGGIDIDPAEGQIT